MARTWVLEQQQFVPRPRSEVFAFFADAFNLERITPDFLGFRILTPAPIEMAAGTIIEYRIKLYGVPMRWRTRIERWEPEERFVDVQEKGPYARWHHTHEFEEVEGGTLMRDRVAYAVPFGPVGSLARILFVRRAVERIFAHRRSVIAELFGE